MPVFLPPQHTRLSNDYPYQYMQPKCEGPFVLPGSNYALQHAASSEADLNHPDPYNYNKRGPSPSAYSLYNDYHNEPLSARNHMPDVQHLHVETRNAPTQGGFGARRGYQPSPFKVHDHEVQDEKVVGGVSAQLDYEMETMIDFVVEMATSVIRPTSPYDKVMFRKWVLQVLNATRLPSATVVLSLSYLALRINGLSAKRQYVSTERALYQMLTVALILGSKFLDDNTFQNKSWAEVSNISVGELNLDEMEWLAAFDHRLHHDPAIADGFNSWQAKWISFKSRPIISVPALLSLDVNAHASRTGRQSISPSGYHHQYPVSAMSSMSLEPACGQGLYTPTYSPFQSWYGQRPGNRSPSTASHTGPNTPDYYSAPSRWGSSHSQSSRDLRLGYSSLPHLTADLGVYQSHYDAALYGGPSVWNCHGHACNCSNCRAAAFQPRYGPLMAAS